MQRHIQFSNGPYSSRTPEQVSFSSPHSASVSKPSRSSNVVPSSSHLSKDTRTLSGDYLLGHGEMASKDHDCQSTHSAGSGSWQSHSSAEHSKYPGRSGKASDKAREKKHSFSKQANNNANMNVSSSWVQKSYTPIHQGTDSKMGRRPFNNAPIHQGTDCKMGRRPFNDAPRQPEWLSTTPSQEFCRPSPQRTSSMVLPNKEGYSSLVAANISSEGSSRTMMNIQHNYQQQQLKSPRQYESRGNQMSALSTDSSRGNRNLHEKSNLKDSGSPFQAMVKDALKEQAGMKDANRVFPPPQRSAGAYRDSNKGNEMGWHAKEQPQAHGQESQIFSRFDVSSKDRAQNVQAQSTASPLHGGLFPYTPMQGKWGDIVDDPVEPYDYLQIRRESEKGAHFSQPYAGSEQGNSAVPDAKASRTMYQDPGHDRRMISNYGTKNLQKHMGLVRDQPTSEMSARKSVFERLGPKNNFQDSILGPPPKMHDSRGVLIASPDGAASSALPGASYKNFNAGFQDSQRPFQTPSAWCENPDNSREVGKEVVVQAYTEPKKRRGKRELYVPRGGS
ncbi:hypothetical protein KP509_32G048600 [Ceratopteris richardii]|nr:hypothetical protein KP509_32G048600 [Ceratopteris richardii]